MCLILFAWDTHPELRVVVAANRDEFHRRRTLALSRWPDLPIIAGRDRLAGGTWMGVRAERPSRVAMVTNVRDGLRAEVAGPHSRGELPVQFLTGTDDPESFARRVVERAEDYQPVNLLVGDDDELWWATNWPQPVARRVPPGVHGLSNGALDSDWPKVTDGASALTELVAADRRDASVEPYLDLLRDETRPDAALLPDTGVPEERESDLSPIFVNMPGYGTRASTVLRVGYDGHGEITERRFGWRGRQRGTTTIRF
ncbi:NRDE family protein [Gordonia rhizosphera]|uniref:NRDE family protein n=1 Tax=Gordonia rhizosphera NBRC 16068 TaxID=1108045 RepID=K6WIE8_9ACTN|nr:NRDE family protein [Gordonia rhizosphera]GAB91927.1 hypothetical protein GORHZ_154_00160 [Gordonia rhizosphera NBRC 16068]